MQNDTYIRFESASDREDLLPLLYNIYVFESRKVGGSHGGTRKFSDCIWTYEEIEPHLCASLALDPADINVLFQRLVSLLTAAGVRQMLTFTRSEVQHFITRLAELIRTTGNLHEFQNRINQETDDEQKFSIIEGTQWYPILRYSAPRSLTKNDLLLRLNAKLAGMTHVSDEAGGHSVEHVLEDLTLVLDAIALMPKYVANGGLRYSEFQVESIVLALLQSWTSTAGNALVVTADTGMGKTLSFSIPTLVSAVSSLRNEERSMNQLLLYPRNALAKDQFQEVQNMAKYVNKKLHDSGQKCIGIALDADGLIKSSERYVRYPLPSGMGPEWGVGTGNVFEASAQVYGGESAAEIVLASIESFRRRLRNPTVVSGLKRGLSRIVFDEVHLSSGLQGGHHHFLVGRLKQLLYDFNPDENRKHALRLIGVSATIAKPKQHLQKIWGGAIQFIKHVEGMVTSTGSPVGLMHHVMYKPRLGTPMVGALVDLSSSVTHQRRARDFTREGTSPAQLKRLQKTIGFSDSHQVVGDWWSFMLPNESTEKTSNNRRLPGSDGDLRRPYAHWHSKPLSLHDGGSAVCESCQAGAHHSTPIDVLGSQLGLIKQKISHTADGADTPSWNYNNCIDPEATYSISGLETCTYLEMGKCWWFAPRTGEMESRPGDIAYESFKEVTRTKRFTSITKRGEPEDDADQEMSANKVFASKPKFGAYENTHSDAEQNNTSISHDFVIATPTLEVGVDMDNVSEVITHKAIRNISSYRQKVGRAGREPGSDALAVTLASRRASDFGHYRSMNRLVSDKISDPVPVASNNSTILKHHAYEAVFDYLARRGINLESIPRVRYPRNDTEIPNWEAVNQTLVDAIAQLNQLSCLTYLQYSVPETSEEIRNRAREVVIEQLQILLNPFPGLITKEASLIQWLAHFKRTNSRLRDQDENSQYWQSIELWTTNEALRPIPDGLEENVLSQTQALSDKIIEAVPWKDVRELKSICEDIIVLVSANSQINTFGTITPYIDLLIDADPIPPIVRQLKELRRYSTWYLSIILEKVDTFLDFRPYITLPSYFTNPHETSVAIRGDGQQGSYFIENVTCSEALRYLQPGMFTHRIGKGKRYFVDHSRRLEQIEEDGGVWTYDLSEVDFEFKPLGVLDTDQTARISTLLDVQIPPELPMVAIKSLHVSPLNGATSGRNFVTLSLEDNTEGLLIFYDVESGGPQAPKILPKAHSVSWTLTDLEGGTEVQTYLLQNILSEERPSTLNGIRHPLMSHLFSSVKYNNQINVTKVGLGVSRSNLVTIQPQFNGSFTAYGDIFTTNGMRFTLSSAVRKLVADRAQSAEVKFSTQTLDMVAYWIRTQKEIFGKISSYTIDAFVDVLVENAWIQSNTTNQTESFPETEVEFLNLLFNSGNSTNADTIERRATLTSITNDNMNQNITEELQSINTLFSQNAADLITNLQTVRSEWYRVTFNNTLGVLLAESVAEFAGVQGDAVSYTVNFENGDTDWCIDVFDNEAEGNGSCDLAREFFHFPAEIRHMAHYFGEKHLPSESFIELLERKLVVCDEHLLHQAATSGILPDGLPPWLERDYLELRTRFSSVWDELQIGSTDTARLHHMRRFSIREPDNRADQLDLELALYLCANGCPACNGDDMANQLPPQLIRFATNRGLLDSVIGRFSDLHGYQCLVENTEQIHNSLGAPVEHVEEIYLRRSSDDTYQTVRFIQNLGASIGFNFQRHQRVEQNIDLVVRTQEVI